jgi:transposase
MTARWRTREELTHQVVLLTTQGMSRRAITRALGVSRNTIRKILRAHDKERDTGHTALATRPGRVPRPAKIDTYLGRVDELLLRYPDITAQRVWETLREEGFGGGYTGVKKHLRRVRPPPRPTPSLEAPVFGPGEMAESDWSPYEVTYTDGRTETLQLFAYVLVFSKRKFFDAFGSVDLFALMDGHERAFARFGGYAAACKYDSQKPVVLRWEGAQPIYNPRYLAFAAHYGIRPAAVRGQPNAKPRVERSFWEHERSFLNGRSFRDREDFRAQLTVWLDRVVDPRQRHGQSALDRFRDEAPHLRPLPTHPYDTARVTYRLCSIDGYVEWQGNRYAVPYDHVTDFLPLRVTQSELFVYGPDLHCLVRYELRPRGRGEKIDPLGLHPRPDRQAVIDGDKLRATFAQMGDGATMFLAQLATLPTRVWTHHARQILLLRARYDTADVDAALAHAARFGALDVASVERILARCHRPRTLDEYVAEETAKRIDAVLGPSVTTPRDLAEYDALPLAARASTPTEPPDGKDQDRSG